MSIYTDISDACDFMKSASKLAKEDGSNNFGNYLDQMRLEVWNTFVEEYCAGNNSVMYTRIEEMLEDEAV